MRVDPRPARARQAPGRPSRVIGCSHVVTYVITTGGRGSYAMVTLKLTQIGNSVGAVFPKEALAKLGVGKGDTLYLTEAPDGALQISPYDPAVARQVAIGEEIMDEFRDTLRILAK